MFLWKADEIIMCAWIILKVWEKGFLRYAYVTAKEELCHKGEQWIVAGDEIKGKCLHRGY